MNKNNKDKNRINEGFFYEKDFKNVKIKTTNINILLNRVKLDQKRVFKKKIFITISTVLFLGLLILIVL